MLFRWYWVALEPMESQFCKLDQRGSFYFLTFHRRTMRTRRRKCHAQGHIAAQGTSLRFPTPRSGFYCHVIRSEGRS